MRRSIAFLLAGATLLSLAGCAWFAPKEMPLDGLALGAFSQGTQEIQIEEDQSVSVERLALQVGESTEIPLALPEVKDLSVALSCGDPEAVSAQIGPDGLLRVEGLAQTDGTLVELTLSAPWHQDGVFRFLVAVALRPAEIAVLPLEGQEALESPLELTVGEELTLPLSLPQGMTVLLDPLPQGSPLEAELREGALILRAVSPGEETLTLRADATPVYAAAETQLPVKVLPKPTPVANVPSSLYQTANRTVDQSAYEEIIQGIIAQTNRMRTDRGLAPLARIPGVEVCAAIRAQEASRLWDHTRPDGRDFSTIFDDCGLAYTYMGENLHSANFSRTAQEVVDAFMNSESHRENILRGTFAGIGVGVYQEGADWYYCQIFVGL